MLDGGFVFDPSNGFTAAPPPIDTKPNQPDKLDLELVQSFHDTWKRDPRNMGPEFEELKEARTEYYDFRIHLSLWASNAEFEKTFNSKPNGDEGRYILQYFHFLKFIIFSNLVMTIWCFIGWIPHAQNARPLFTKEGMGESMDSSAVQLLFLSSYQPSSDKYWTAMMVLGTIWMMCSGILYVLMCYYMDRKNQDFDTPNHREISYLIHPDRELPQTHRLVFTYLILLVVCLIPIGINYALLYVWSRQNAQVASSATCHFLRTAARAIWPTPPSIARRSRTRRWLAIIRTGIRAGAPKARTWSRLRSRCRS